MRRYDLITMALLGLSVAVLAALVTDADANFRPSHYVASAVTGLSSVIEVSSAIITDGKR
jgi:hypothetical protein